MKRAVSEAEYATLEDGYVAAVSPHVISRLSRFLNKNSNRGIFEIENKDAPRFFDVA